MSDVCVYLGILESLLEVVVDGFIADLADKRQIADTHILLLGRLKDCSLDAAFPAGG